MEQDHVDLILAQWRQERPDLDPSPMGIMGRISRLHKLISRRVEARFAEHGIGSDIFDVLATLRRSGPPYRLTPTRLFQMLMVTSGTMTARLDRLEKAGYVVRMPDPDDRRGTLIELTPTGSALVDEAVAAHLANEREMLSGLTGEEQALLTGLLRKWCLSLESDR